MVTAIQSKPQAACLGEEGSVDRRAGEESTISSGVVTGNDEVVHGVAQSRDQESFMHQWLGKIRKSNVNHPISLWYLYCFPIYTS
jgi:hypothetical protein